MMPIVSWRVWTIDGQVFQSTAHTWQDVPETGIAALCVYYDPPPYRDFTYGVDEYRLDGEPGVKLGAWMADDAWEALRQAIHADRSRP